MNYGLFCLVFFLFVPQFSFAFGWEGNDYCLRDSDAESVYCRGREFRKELVVSADIRFEEPEHGDLESCSGSPQGWSKDFLGASYTRKLNLADREVFVSAAYEEQRDFADNTSFLCVASLFPNRFALIERYLEQGAGERVGGLFGRAMRSITQSYMRAPIMYGEHFVVTLLRTLCSIVAVNSVIFPQDLIAY